jgi:hypothetical protein
MASFVLTSPQTANRVRTRSTEAFAASSTGAFIFTRVYFRIEKNIVTELHAIACKIVTVAERRERALVFVFWILDRVGNDIKIPRFNLGIFEDW